MIIIFFQCFSCNLYWSSLNVTGPETKPTNFVDRFRNNMPKRRVKEILHNVSGMAESGKLLAILGSSGAGKTTLMNVLTSRNLTNLDVQGSILIDGRRANKWKIREVCEIIFLNQNSVLPDVCICPTT